MKVLYLSYDGMTDPLGQSQVLPYLIGLQRKLGIKFYLVSFEKEAVFAKRESTIRRLTQSAGIMWLPQIYHKSPPVLSTIYDLWKMYRVGRKISLLNDIRIIHARSYLPGLVALMLKQKFSFKFIFDIRGFWIEERIEGGLWNLSNPIFRSIYNYLKRKEKLLYKNADAIITLTHTAKDLLQQKFILGGEITVIPCAADLEHFTNQGSEKRASMRKNLGIGEEELALVYVGSLGTWYQLDEMLLFFKALLEKKANSTMYFFTLEQAESILSKAASTGISKEKIKVIGVQREEMPSMLSAMDASVFFIRDTYSKKASSPTKHGELLAMHLPCVHNSVGDLSEISRAGKTSVLVENFSNDELRRAADQLLSEQFSGFDEVASLYYDLETGIKQYEKVYLTF